MERVDINVGGNGISLGLGVRKPRLRSGTSDAIVMNSGATLAEGTVNAKQDVWRERSSGIIGTQCDDCVCYLPRAGRDPRQTRLGSMGGHIDKTRIVQVQQLGHLQLFFPVRIRTICIDKDKKHS